MEKEKIDYNNEILKVDKINSYYSKSHILFYYLTFL